MKRRNIARLCELMNTKATTVPLTQGLVATSQNRWPSLRFDVMAINQVFAPVLVAGTLALACLTPNAQAQTMKGLLGGPEATKAVAEGDVSGVVSVAIECTEASAGPEMEEAGPRPRRASRASASGRSVCIT